jgi:hypothetical protein
MAPRYGSAVRRRLLGPIDANLAHLGPHARRASSADDGAFIEDFCSWARLERMERFIRTSPGAAIVGAVMGAAMMRLYHDHVLVKEAGTRQRAPWHQDLPYDNVDGRQNVSMWCPVGPSPVRRPSNWSPVPTAARGTCPAPSSTGQPGGPAGSLAELPDVDGDPARPRCGPTAPAADPGR